MTTEPLIEIRDISKVFPGRKGSRPTVALMNVSLAIQENEFVTVLGPSGCGKTTLLRAIGGLVGTDHGAIFVDGGRVQGPGPERAMVFQDFALLPWRTVTSNVSFSLELRGVAKAAREAKAREFIHLVGLSEFSDRFPRELSGGMQQRVGLARALAVEPRVLLMDEPFGALDEQTRRLLQEQLLHVWEARRVTVVFVTHSMDEAVLLGDRVVLMGPGRIEEIVPVDLPRPRAASVGQIERSPAFVEITGHLWERLRTMQHDVPEGLVQ